MASCARTALVDQVRDVLAEAKYFWLRCHDTYHEVPAFGYNLDATIQALRNVTFRLQAYADDDSVAAWYCTWRTYLKNRPETAWLNRARVGVVHRKGLAKHSSAVARLLYTYGEVQQNEYAWSPIMADEELVEEVRKDINPELAGVVLVLIDRRWVAEDYPSAEVLNLLADCFTVLSALAGALAVLAAGGVPAEPEETVADFARDEDMRHVDGVVRLCVDPFSGKKYGEDDSLYRWIPFNRNFDGGDLPDSAVELAEMALPNLVDGLANGDDIVAMIWFHAGPGVWVAAPFRFEDHLDKLRLAYKLGEVVEQNDYDAVVLFTMVWCGSMEEVPPLKGGLTDMEAMENKTEALMLMAVSRDGEQVTWLVPVESTGHGAVLGETNKMDGGGDLAMFWAVEAAWRGTRRQ